MTWLKIIIQTLTHLIGKKADKRDVEQLRRDTIPAPATASLGQTIVVKTVDDNGKPIEWEAREAGGGSGSAEPDVIIGVLGNYDEHADSDINDADWNLHYAKGSFANIRDRFATGTVPTVILRGDYGYDAAYAIPCSHAVYQAPGGYTGDEEEYSTLYFVYLNSEDWRLVRLDCYPDGSIIGTQLGLMFPA